MRLVYREQALGLDTGKTPLLQDLYEELLKQPEPEARRVATALELYCTGSLNLFNHPIYMYVTKKQDLVLVVTKTKKYVFNCSERDNLIAFVQAKL